jgi:hypothetical protein
MSRPKRKLSPLVAITGYGVCVLVALFAVWLSPVPGSDVAVLVWPGREARFEGIALHHSGADMIARSRWPNLIIARPNRTDFIARAYQHGAILIFNPRILAGCQV